MKTAALILAVGVAILVIGSSTRERKEDHSDPFDEQRD